MFAYCLNNPVINFDPAGNLAVIDDMLILGGLTIAAFVGIGTVLVAQIPIVSKYNVADQQFADIALAKTKGKERIRDSELAEKSDDEILEKSRDKSLPPKERLRYQKELKARGLRNMRKRAELYSISIGVILDELIERNYRRFNRMH